MFMLRYILLVRNKIRRKTQSNFHNFNGHLLNFKFALGVFSSGKNYILRGCLLNLKSTLPKMIKTTYHLTGTYNFL